MLDLLPPLLTQREAILRQIAELGDMRRGTITEVFRSCGKAGCCCSERKHPGHGPYYAFTSMVEGNRPSAQALDRPRCQCHHRPQMLRPQRSLGAVLGGPLRVVSPHIYDAHPSPPP